MKCPFCKKPQQTRVVDSRTIKEGRTVRRRRECLKCRERFTTYEDIELLRLTVIKRDGTKEEYDRYKVENGLRKALEKRPVTEERIEKLIAEIEYEIQSKEKREMKSRVIGKIIMDKLRDVDDVAFIRFASVYKAIGSADSFRKVIQDIMKD
ncbi:MAG TPA: transcriptional repressor NrdR [Candidatus Pacebacteria bacterium]|nr:transcriptional repressor NrdR [Candidatus Paceibacterota bacterium]